MADSALMAPGRGFVLMLELGGVLPALGGGGVLLFGCVQLALPRYMHPWKSVALSPTGS